MRREPGQGDVAGDGTLELWFLSGWAQIKSGGDPQVSMGAVECGLMQWVRAACVRPAPPMRVCARSYLCRASIVKTVVDIFATTFKCLSVCVSVCLSLLNNELNN